MATSKSDDEGVLEVGEIRRKGQTTRRSLELPQKKLENEGKNLTGWTHFSSYFPLFPAWVPSSFA